MAIVFRTILSSAILCHEILWQNLRIASGLPSAVVS
jgi:hypothetical protein